MALEKYASLAAMKKHEKGEGAKMAAKEDKMGIKDVVAGKSKAHKEMMFKKKTAKKK